MKAYLEIEMPTNCAHCMMWSICPALPNGEWPDYESILTNDAIGDGGAAPGIRHPDCPLVPVPPHGDLIDADKLVELCDIMADKCDGIGASIWHQFKTTVEWSPIVIPEEEGKT